MFNWLNLIFTALGALIAVAFAIGFYRAKFGSSEKRIGDLEKRCDHMEHDTGKKIDGIRDILIELVTKVNLILEGRIKFDSEIIKKK